MSGLDKERIALVVAKSEADGQTYEEVATGYFLTGDLVLSAGHVADDRSSTFEIRAEVGGSGPALFHEADVVWRGAPDVDAVLLRTRDWVREWALPTFQTSAPEGDWSSCGFAAAARDEKTGDRKTLDLGGDRCGLSSGQGEPELQLTTAANLRESWAKEWKGVSGAPVFLGDELIGLITDATPKLSNMLIGLPVARLLDDVQFRTILRPSFLGQLPSTPYCLVLTREQSRAGEGLVDQVSDVLAMLRGDNHFENLYVKPIKVSVLEATRSVENWANTVAALARADYVIADVSEFEPAIMMFLGIRSVVRRGVTVSVTGDEITAATAPIPFNVQETNVLPYDADGFDGDLRQALAEGATNLARDANYLDLPAYYAVRAPRPESWAQDDAKTVLVLCPFQPVYSSFYRKTLSSIIRAQMVTAALSAREKDEKDEKDDKKPEIVPVRMLDLKSPRLVGQALYEQIRWASRCLVDWTHWRPNVSFELGVRLACSEYDPLCIIQKDEPGHDSVEVDLVPPLEQHALLRELLRVVEYDRATPREVLNDAIKEWASTTSTTRHRASATEALPPSATFKMAQTSFLWQQDMLKEPHLQQREEAERIFGRDPEQHPERLTLFADNEQFKAALRAAVREKWVAVWLCFENLCTTADSGTVDSAWEELISVGQMANRALSSSDEPRHKELRKKIQIYLNEDRTRRNQSAGRGSDG
jgi:hypothetical protein